MSIWSLFFIFGGSSGWFFVFWGRSQIQRKYCARGLYFVCFNVLSSFCPGIRVPSYFFSALLSRRTTCRHQLSWAVCCPRASPCLAFSLILVSSAHLYVTIPGQRHALPVFVPQLFRATRVALCLVFTLAAPQDVDITHNSVLICVSWKSYTRRSMDEERVLRKKSQVFVFDCCKHLGVPVLVMSAAASICQRYFTQVSFRKVDRVVSCLVFLRLIRVVSVVVIIKRTITHKTKTGYLYRL